MKMNPRVQRNALLLLGAAVVGPALVIAGLKYPGTWKTKGFLVATGAGVSGISYYYLSSDVRALLTTKE
jgi:hypothetical protein